MGFDKKAQGFGHEQNDVGGRDAVKSTLIHRQLHNLDRFFLTSCEHSS